ncbi:hypothetical protein PV08_09991 [Exophiala spinifera]|uniref:Uncharacterized protein n=1 Tax=Exophiala spinifera TaxID=91928 RepID=A0A0D2B1B3_9EURO|nr:uncharacterized protein PV08_09991 [Exophiala spinifera]KIW12713.1 hypothetical protein PV08_09991 [Exophiala spinifera]
MGSLAQLATDSDDIAVIGLSCRFPGGASTTDKFWNLLYNSESAYTEVPKSRFNVDAFYHAGDKLGTLRCRGGHFLDGDISAFDAPFFNITAQDAKAMDPTARMLLEVTYEALENAGLRLHDLAGSDTGCYIGCFTRDWHEQQIKDSETAPMYAGTGTGFSLLSNRVSWAYDLRGPSITLDTACSSSLVGLHLACQSLKSKESKLAIVCGANLILSPDLAIFLSNLHMLSKEGLSRSFAAGTSGYGRGEGIATLILKPLADAVRDGDPIRAVIRGTGVNQDGHTTGITVPNSDAQADLILSTYSAAKLDLSETAYFEAHGTGTAVGDPLELAAVARTLGKARKQDNIVVGSVKSNIGHLEGAAGLAGVIKCILMLERGTILPNIHFDQPNRRIPFDDWKITVPTSALPWPQHLSKRTSVNSFGYGGTNAHAIIDNAEDFLRSQGWHEISQGSGKEFPRKRLFVVSAPTDAGLDRLRKQFCEYLDSIKADAELAYMTRLAYTLSHRRTRFDWKAHVVASTLKELREQLSAPSISASRSSATPPALAFVFTGQGAQWARMGVELMQLPTFKASIFDAQAYLTSIGCDWSLIHELEQSQSSSNIQLAKFSQPICTILQVALVDLLRHWGIFPGVVLGHSSGEIAAAYAYGALTCEDAWLISYWRGKLCSELSNTAPELKGSMAAAGLSQAEALEHISRIDPAHGRLVVACINSPTSVTISGDESAMDVLGKKLKEASIFFRKLKVENAYHSHHMQRIAAQYLEKISGLQPKSTPSQGVTMASSVTGQRVPPGDLGPEYWVRNLVSPVLFLDAVQTLFTASNERRRRARTTHSTNINITVEIGPHSALKGPLRQILQAQDISGVDYVSVLTRGDDGLQSALDAAGALYDKGVPVDLLHVNDIVSKPKVLTDLPPYPWNHTLKYWSESRLSRNYRNRQNPYHDLIGTVTTGYNTLAPTWRNILKTSEKPWLRDHVVQDTILYPAAGILVMPIEAMRQLADPSRQIDNIQLKDVRIGKAVVVPDDSTGVEVTLQLHRQKAANSSLYQNEWWSFTVASCTPDQEPEENAFGMVSVRYTSDNVTSWPATQQAKKMLESEYRASCAQCTHHVGPEDFYKTTQQAGLNYGPAFQGLTQICTSKRRCHCIIAIPDTKAIMPEGIESEHLIHPTTLDIIFHSLFAALGDDRSLNLQTAAVPVSFEQLTIAVASLPSGAGATYHGFCTARRDGPREIVADICYSDQQWDGPKVHIQGIRCRELPRLSSTASADSLKAPLGTLEWKPDISLAGSGALDGILSKTATFQEGLTKANWISTNNQFVQIMELTIHKNPKPSILQLRGVLPSSNHLVPLLTDTHNIGETYFERFAYVDSDPQSLHEARLALEPWKSKASCIEVPDGAELPGEVLPTKSFNAVIVWPKAGSRATGEQEKSKLKTLLQEGGLLICLNPGVAVRTKYVSFALHMSLQSNVDSDGDAGLARTEGLTLLGHTIYQDETTSLTLTVELRSSEIIPPEGVCIIEPVTTSKRTEALSQALDLQLSECGLPAVRYKWPIESAQIARKPIISLLEAEDAFLTECSSADFGAIKGLTLHCGSLLWISGGGFPVAGAPMGFMRVIKNENPNLDLRYLALEDYMTTSDLGQLAANILRVAFRPTVDREFKLIADQIHISRWTEDEKLGQMIKDKIQSPTTMLLAKGVPSLQLHRSVAGSASYFTATATDIADRVLAADQIEVEVKAFKLSDTESSAKEFSGTVKTVGSSTSRLRVGDRVFGCQVGPYRTTYKISESLCHTIPEQVTFEDAATWAITLGTAHKSIFSTAQIRQHHKVLVQGATLVGVAAIQLAKGLGADVHLSVKNNSERQLGNAYGIPDHQIFHEEDPNLQVNLMAITDKAGFDTILVTSANGEDLATLWKCVTDGGHLINTVGGFVTGALDLAPFQKGCHYSQIDTIHDLETNPKLVADTLKNLSIFVKTQSVVVKPHLEVFSAAKVADALAYVQEQDGPHEAIITISNSDEIPVSPDAKSPLRLKGDATYVITGGTGGLGRSLARLLFYHGARNLVFISRSGLKSGNAQTLVDEMTALGISVRVYAGDVSDADRMKEIVASCSSELPQIRGVIQSAAVLNDAIYENLTYESWREAIKPKVHGSWLLHQLLPRDMDFFVMLSSIAGVVGNRSQAAYATGNTYQDALAKYRRDLGLPAVSIDLGLMTGIGLIAERGGFTNLRKSEAVALNETELHSIVRSAIVGFYGDSKVPPQLVTGLPSGGILHRQGLDSPFYYDDPRFAFLEKLGLDQAIVEMGGTPEGSDTKSTLSSLLEKAKTLAEATNIITAAICAQLAKGLQTTTENIDPEKTIHSYGVDSLMAVEIRGWILQQIKADISLFEVLSGQSISTLAAKVSSASKLVPAGLE